MDLHPSFLDPTPSAVTLPSEISKSPLAVAVLNRLTSHCFYHFPHYYFIKLHCLPTLMTQI